MTINFYKHLKYAHAYLQNNLQNFESDEASNIFYSIGSFFYPRRQRLQFLSRIGEGKKKSPEGNDSSLKKEKVR